MEKQSSLSNIQLIRELKKEKLCTYQLIIFFLEQRLLDVIDYLYKQTDVRLFCIDEIHKYPNWLTELKNIISSHLEITQEISVKQVLKHFNNYLKIGYYPFFQGFTHDLEKFQSLENADDYL